MEQGMSKCNKFIQCKSQQNITIKIIGLCGTQSNPYRNLLKAFSQTMFDLSSQCSLAQETFSIFQDVDASGRPVRKVCKINFPVEYCLNCYC